MNTVALWLRYSRLRRPFSRKIHLGPDDILTDAGRDAFLAGFGPLAGKFPLVAALAALAHAYRGDGAASEAGVQDIERLGFVPELNRLYDRSDLRKFCLDCFRDCFDANAAMPPETLGALYRLAFSTDAEARRILDAPEVTPVGVSTPPGGPIRFDYAPTVPKALKIRAYCRPRFFGATSRPHDFGPRLETAFAAADCAAADPETAPAAIEPCDLALVDDVYAFRKSPGEKRRFLEKLRPKAARIAMLELDPWMPGVHERVSKNRDLYDFVWTMAPSLAGGGTGDHGIGGLPVCVIPFPVGCPGVFDRFTIDDGDDTLEPLGFSGGVEEYNLHRYYWLLAASRFSPPVPFTVTNHKDDGLSAVESLEHYVEKLAGAYGSLNFTMRKDGRTAIVGRTFDCLRLGRLLVQEASADMHRYFTPGAHYLEFRTVAELEEICAGLNRPGAFADVRAEGAAYFGRHYSDDAVLRHLVTYL